MRYRTPVSNGNGNGTSPGPRRRNVYRRSVPGRAVTADELSHADNVALANGAAHLLNVVDRRSALARRYKAVISQLITDQGDGISEARMQLLQRFAGCCILAEQSEVKVISGGSIDLSEYSQLISSLVRVASRIGLDRVAKNITPSLRQYLDQKPVEIDADADGEAD